MKKSIVSLALIGGLTITGFGSHQADAASATSVVNLAQQGVGSAYSWGQNDCSGFTMRVFSQLGVQLPHNAAAQAGYGTSVSRSDLQPGDLVFFNTSGGGISHVGIYVGNNRMISAETEKTGVRETQIFGGGASSYWEPKFVTARRIVTSGQQATAQQSAQTDQSQNTPKESTASQSSSTQGSSNEQTQNSASIDQSSTADQTKSSQSDESSTTDQTKSTQSNDLASANDGQDSKVNTSKNDNSNSSSNETSSSQTINNGVYIVQTGDTLWAISNKNGISVRKIQQINKLEDTLIHPGQKINLQDPSEKYTIKSGDSLWSIAKKHGTTVEQLMKTNNLSSDLIYPDDKLTVSDN